MQKLREDGIAAEKDWPSAALFVLRHGTLAAGFFEENRASIKLLGTRCGHMVSESDFTIVEVRSF